MDQRDPVGFGRGCVTWLCGAAQALGADLPTVLERALDALWLGVAPPPLPELESAVVDEDAPGWTLVRSVVNDALVAVMCAGERGAGEEAVSNSVDTLLQESSPEYVDGSSAVRAVLCEIAALVDGRDALLQAGAGWVRGCLPVVPKIGSEGQDVERRGRGW